MFSQFSLLGIPEDIQANIYYFYCSEMMSADDMICSQIEILRFINVKFKVTNKHIRKIIDGGNSKYLSDILERPSYTRIILTEELLNVPNSILEVLVKNGARINLKLLRYIVKNNNKSLFIKLLTYGLKFTTVGNRCFVKNKFYEYILLTFDHGVLSLKFNRNKLNNRSLRIHIRALKKYMLICDDAQDFAFKKQLKKYILDKLQDLMSRGYFEVSDYISDIKFM